MNDKVTVLVVDDSITYRQILVSIIEKISEAESVGTASSGAIALRKIAALLPDLVLLDVDMPNMDGVAILQQIKQSYPTVEVILISDFALDDTKKMLNSLQINVLAFVAKPSDANVLVRYLQPFIHLLQTRKYAVLGQHQPRTITRVKTPQNEPIKKADYDLCVIGVSTGGPEALDQLIPQLDNNLPCPIIIVQHMPPNFTHALAEKLNSLTRLQVLEARGGETLKSGYIYIAQGGKHLVLRTALEGGFYLAANDAPPVHHCKPSVDVLFRSVAAVFTGKVLAIVMTGMGRDGTDGVRMLKTKGCRCLVQDEASSVVWGMPKSVYEAGLADEVLPLKQLGVRISALVFAG